MPNYLTNKEIATLKRRLTNAQKKGPRAVVMEVHHAVGVFDDHVWPDNWAHWQRALTDQPGLMFYHIDDVRSPERAEELATYAEERAGW